MSEEKAAFREPTWEEHGQLFERDIAGGQPQPHIVGTEMIRKQVMWNLTPDEVAKKVIYRLGMVPGSDEVEELERAASHERIHATAVLDPTIIALSQHASEAILATIAEVYGDETAAIDYPDQHRLAMLFLHATKGIVSELVALDLVHLPHYQQAGQ